MASSHRSITLPVHACQVGSLSSANTQGNPRPGTNLEITGWLIRAVTASGIKKVTCLQAEKPVRCQLLSAQICLMGPGPSFGAPQACQCHQRPPRLAWGGQTCSEGAMEIECRSPTPSCCLCKMASPFCPSKSLLRIVRITTAALLQVIRELKLQLCSVWVPDTYSRSTC